MATAKGQRTRRLVSGTARLDPPAPEVGPLPNREEGSTRPHSIGAAASGIWSRPRPGPGNRDAVGRLYARAT
jgi:hypothetical protein